MMTPCTHCGSLYEAGSEEQANEPVRYCPECWYERRGSDDLYRRAIDEIARAKRSAYCGYDALASHHLDLAERAIREIREQI